MEKVDKVYQDAMRLWKSKAPAQGIIEKFEEAARLGHGEAMATLGAFYEHGTFTDGERDGELAVKWYKKAYENGFEPIVVNLGNIYYNGEIVEKNVPEAIEWYKIAAKNGNNGIQNRLGYIYYSGNGVEQNFDIAIAWFERAAENGDADAINNIWAMHKEGCNFHMNRDELFHWIYTAGMNGNSDALCEAAEMIVEEDGTQLDKKYAMTCYDKAMRMGNGYAACCAGDLCVEQGDDNEAFYYYSKSAELGDPVGKYKLSICYKDGIGTKANSKLQKYWSEQAAMAGVNLQTGELEED